jgi:hypothetical protein
MGKVEKNIQPLSFKRKLIIRYYSSSAMLGTMELPVGLLGFFDLRV